MNVRLTQRALAAVLGAGLLLVVALPSAARPPAVSAPLNSGDRFECTVVNRADVPQQGVISLINDAGQVKKSSGAIVLLPGHGYVLKEDGVPNRRYCRADFPEFVSGELHVLDDLGDPIGRSLLTVPIWK